MRFSGLRAIVAIMVLAWAVAGSSGCARRGLVLAERSDSVARAIVIGDVRAGEQGDATERRMWSVPDEMFGAALGNSAVVYDSNRQGTAIILDGTAFVHSLKAEELGRVEKAEAEQFSSFLVGIPPRTQPAARYKVNGGSSGITLADIYSEVSGRHGEIVVVVGVGELAFSENLALKKAANQGVAPGENPDEYYEAGQHEFSPKGVFVGIVLADVRDLRGSNMRVFSAEPGRRIDTDHVSRTHFAKLSSIDGVTPDNLSSAKDKVTDVSRLLSMSRVKKAELLVYKVGEFEKR